MENLRRWLSHFLSFYLSITTTVLKFMPHVFRLSIFVFLVDVMLSLYYRFCGLASCTLEVDDQTSMHFWVPLQPKSNKPNLIIIHGYGSDSKWQMSRQVGPLAKLFNLYSPDLLFFGKSYTSRPDRSEAFQAKCVAEGMKKLGVMKYSVFGISYGGFVTYRMAEMNPEAVEKVVIASSGIGCTEEQKMEQVRKVGKHVADLLLPEKAEDLRLLVRMAFSKRDPFKWVPDWVLEQLLWALGQSNRKEKKELVECLLTQGGCPLPNITMDTLLLWGDKDKVFPLTFAHQLQRQLGPKAKLQILKNTGHASNLESAAQVNESIKSFVLFGSADMESCNGKHM